MQPDLEPRDVVLRGGTIITMDDGRHRTDALWLHADRIGAAASEAEVRAAAPTTARVVDLDGAVVLPGFVDAHCHLGAIAYLLATVDCSPEVAGTIPAILDSLATAARAWSLPGGWVTGHSFSEAGVAERRFPTRDELDAAVPNQPCVLYHRSMHACILNSRALQAAGLDWAEDPALGVLGRDPSGRPDGRVFEAPMFRIFAETSGAFLLALDATGRADRVRAAAALFLAEGVTTVMDADLPGLGGVLTLRDIDAAEGLPLRVVAMVNDADMDAAPDGLLGSRGLRFRAPTVKVFSDGGMSSRTAAVERPFTVPPYGRGVLFRDADALEAIIRRCEARGLQVAVHSQGDRALDALFTAFERVLGRGSGNPLRHRIEHGGMLLPPLLARAAEIGIHVVSQPGFFSSLADGWLEAYGEQTQLFYPFRSLRTAGLRVGGSSDAPVIAPRVRVALRDAIVRRSATGVLIGPAERLTADEALELYTRDASWLAWVDDVVGTLEPGKYADLVILGGDPTTVAPEAIPDLPILQTIVGGRPAFGSGPLAG